MGEKYFSKEYLQIEALVRFFVPNKYHRTSMRIYKDKFDSMYSKFRLEKPILVSRKNALEKTLDYILFDTNSRNWDSDNDIGLIAN